MAGKSSNTTKYWDFVAILGPAGSEELERDKLIKALTRECESYAFVTYSDDGKGCSMASGFCTTRYHCAERTVRAWLTGATAELKKGSGPEEEKLLRESLRSAGNGYTMTKDEALKRLAQPWASRGGGAGGPTVVKTEVKREPQESPPMLWRQPNIFEAIQVVEENLHKDNVDGAKRSAGETPLSKETPTKSDKASLKIDPPKVKGGVTKKKKSAKSSFKKKKGSVKRVDAENAEVWLRRANKLRLLRLCVEEEKTRKHLAKAIKAFELKMEE